MNSLYHATIELIGFIWCGVSFVKGFHNGRSYHRIPNNIRTIVTLLFEQESSALNERYKIQIKHLLYVALTKDLALSAAFTT